MNGGSGNIERATGVFFTGGDHLPHYEFDGWNAADKK
jgi:hypothetical protein